MSETKQTTARKIVAALSENTLFMYRYRDANNNKNSATVIFPGTPAVGLEEAKLLLEVSAHQGELFIPEQVGLKGLQGIWGWRVNITADDHEWHEIVTLERTRRPSAQNTELDINNFIQEFATQNWDPKASLFHEAIQEAQKK